MNKYKELTGYLFSNCLLLLRARLDLTQEKMAEQLRITPRAYRELESGRNTCSGTTFLFFLTLIDENDLDGLLKEFRRKVAELEENELA